MAINEDIADRVVAHRLELLRFEAGTGERLVAAYSEALAGLLADVERARSEVAAGRLSRAAVDALRARAEALQGELASLLGTEAAILREALEGVVAVERQVLAQIWADTTEGISIDWRRPPLEEVLIAVDSPIAGRGWEEARAVELLKVHDDIRRRLAVAVARGSSTDALADALSEIPQLAKRGRDHLVTVARTEIQRVANQAADASYRANADILQGVEHLATLDSRTCKICAPLHGEVYDLDDPKRPEIPLHPRCRCFQAPVTKSWTQIGLGPAQASLFDGRPSGGADFESWLSRQPAEVRERFTA